MKPLVLINFKIYPEAIGVNGVKLANAISLAAKRIKNEYDLAIAPSFLDLNEVIKKLKKDNLKVFAQHSDSVSLGAHTGSISVEQLKLIGVEGIILNHSEMKVSIDELEKTIAICRKFNLYVLVCASSIEEAKKILQFKPDYLAYEPKELIGGNISITDSNPELIVRAVNLVQKISPKTRLLCGAGVHNKEDIKHALFLGAKGVLIAHAVCRAKNPRKFLVEMLG